MEPYDNVLAKCILTGFVAMCKASDALSFLVIIFECCQKQ